MRSRIFSFSVVPATYARVSRPTKSSGNATDGCFLQLGHELPSPRNGASSNQNSVHLLGKPWRAKMCDTSEEVSSSPPGKR